MAAQASAAGCPLLACAICTRTRQVLPFAMSCSALQCLRQLTTPCPAALQPHRGTKVQRPGAHRTAQLHSCENGQDSICSLDDRLHSRHSHWLPAHSAVRPQPCNALHLQWHDVEREPLTHTGPAGTTAQPAGTWGLRLASGALSSRCSLAARRGTLWAFSASRSS